MMNPDEVPTVDLNTAAGNSRVAICSRGFYRILWVMKSALVLLSGQRIGVAGICVLTCGAGGQHCLKEDGTETGLHHKE